MPKSKMNGHKTSSISGSKSSSGSSLSSLSCLSVTVTDTEQQEKAKKSTPYSVTVTSSDGRRVVVFRKYQEFLHLHENLKKAYPNREIKFPAKKLFSNYESRKEGLADFLQKVLTDPDLICSNEVKEFVHINTLLERSIPRVDSDLLYEINGVHNTETTEQNKVNLGPSEKQHGRPSDFEFLKVIGKGSFGKVLLAKHKEDGNMYAVKVLNKSHIMRKNEAKHIMSERNVLVKNVKHPFLVGLHYSFQTLDKLYFVLDYVNGGELFYHLQKDRCFSEPRAKFYAAEISSALSYLHSLDIIYRDLKPENILFDSEGHVVLTDFGLSKEGMIGRKTTSTFCGTPEYLAPEVLRKQPYDKTVDWWCLGAVTYEMIYGLPPYYSRDTGEMYDGILHKPLKFRTSAGTPEARSILEQLLQKEKEKRLGAKTDFEEIRNHPFFSTINWKQLETRAIKPPYDPNVDDEMDLRHFDPEFVREPVPASVGRSVTGSGWNVGANGAFEGFSYVPSPGRGFHDSDSN